jgi:phenylacetate-CoA ligase
MGRRLRVRGGYLTSRPLPPSAAPGIVWPPIPSPSNALLFALVAQLDASQWWNADELRAMQRKQLAALLDHAVRTVPLYRERLAPIQDATDPGQFNRIPILARPELQSAGSAIQSSALPPGHEPATIVRTSGSTGRPVQVLSSRMGKLFHGALSVRYHLTHGRNPSKKLAALRRTYHKPGTPDKPQPWIPGFESGPMVSFDVGNPLDEQLEWLAQEAPTYLLTYPSTLQGLLRLSAKGGWKPSGLEQVLTYGEALDARLRAQCESLWGVRLVDAYSAQEIGAIAIQCPEHPHYHVQSEDVLVEVLDATDTACGPGETGRVVVTDLHNFATPLIRYELGDFATVGEACACGRGQPVLKAIIGRTRNLLTLPDGRQSCPRFLTEEWAFDLGVRQIQVHQRDLENIHVSLVTERPLKAAEEQRMLESIRSTLRRHPFKLHIDYVDDIPRDPSGKFEEFKSDVSPA